MRRLTDPAPQVEALAAVRVSTSGPLVCLAVIATVVVPAAAYAGPFTYDGPGDLIQGSGQGRVDSTVYAPGMRFPMEEGPAFANSQVYSAGGNKGPPGGQCDAANYDYPWRDNYCEVRTWEMPLCPAGTGHQGQDVRASTCEKNVHWAVAAVAGEISNVGSYSVYLTADDGTRFDYLHMDSVQVSVGDVVTRGQRIGKVSNNFGGTATTIHLHFNIMQNVAGLGYVYVPPYTSLVASYQALVAPLNQPTSGALDAADCVSVNGWAQDPDDPESASSVEVTFDGVSGNPDAHAVTLAADEDRDDLCATIGSCEHGFTAIVPASLRDGRSHVVRAYGLDAAMGATAELAGSPRTIVCPPAPSAGAGGEGGAGGSGGGDAKVRGAAGCSVGASGASPQGWLVAIAVGACALRRRRRERG